MQNEFDPTDPADDANPYVDHKRAQADHERLKIEERQFELEVRRRLHVEVAAVQQAAATAMAALAQTMRSLPDLLERRCGLPPEGVRLVGQTVDEVLASAAASLQAMVPPPAAVAE